MLGGPPLMEMSTTRLLNDYDKVTLQQQPHVNARSILWTPEAGQAAFRV